MSADNRRPALTRRVIADLVVLARATRVKKRSNAGALFETNPAMRAAMRRAKAWIEKAEDWSETERKRALNADEPETTDEGRAFLARMNAAKAEAAR